MKKVNLLIISFINLFLFNVGTAQTITLNEVMFNAVGSDDYDEFIEIVNTGSEPADLSGSYLLINGVTDSLCFVDTTAVLEGGAFGLILDRGYLIDGQSTTYDELIPPDLFKCSIQNNSFGTNGLSNSSATQLLLMSNVGDTLSWAIIYPDQDPGISEEKIDVYGLSGQNNWGNSKFIYGTPGFKNSIARKDVDVAILSFGLRDSTQLIEPGAEIECRLIVANPGRETVSNAEIQFGTDRNSDSLFQSGEVLYSERKTLLPLDTLELYPRLTAVESGQWLLFGRINIIDEDMKNNSSRFSLKVPFPKGCLSINEFMYAPKSDFGGEWVELLNVSPDTIDILGWSVSDNSSGEVISADHIAVPPGGFMLLFSESVLTDYWDVTGAAVLCQNNLPTFNNTQDSIVIRDICGQIIDSLGYTSGWGYEQGVSLEKINSYEHSDLAENWGLSQNPTGGTPGFKNSIAMNAYDLAITGAGRTASVICPKPGRPEELYVTIKNIGRQTVKNAEFQLGLDVNKDSLLQQKEVLYIDILTIIPGDSLILYPKILDHRSGRNLVICSIPQSDDDNENNTFYYRLDAQYPSGGVAINEIMYIPREEYGGEWIELLNVSGDTVNLANWSISDKSSTTELTTENISLAPMEYGVLSSDRSLADYWSIDGIMIQCEDALPILNNAGDSVVVRDLCGHVIDSLKYSNAWGYSQGTSLERINPYRDSDLAVNWTLSQDSVGGTPGHMNSVMIKSVDLSVDSVYILTENPIQGGPLEIGYALCNNGLLDVGEHTVYLDIWSVIGDDRITILDTVIYFPETLESGAVTENTTTFNRIPGGVYLVYCELFCSGDENVGNDADSCELIVGYPENAVVINEVMNIPETGESEWFELYNATDVEIELAGWHFRDANGRWHRITDNHHFLMANEFCVVAAQTDVKQAYPHFTGDLIVPETFPTLNNASDSLFISDGTGHLIERVSFQQSWGGDIGVSIERKNPRSPALSQFNWDSCIDSLGATPGRKNSVLKYQMDLGIVKNSFFFVDSTIASHTTAVFSLDVINTGSRESNSWSINIYRIVNEGSLYVEELVWSAEHIVPILPDSSMNISGEFMAKSSGRTPVFAMVLMDGDENPDNNKMNIDLLVEYPQHSIILNEFLSDPNDRQTEFIEVFNRSESSVFIDGWYLADSRSRVRINDSIEIFPDDYLVFAEDSSFFDFYPLAQVIIPGRWLTLGNSADQIILQDLTAATIDSLAYDESWDNQRGVSFEKILPDLPGYEKQNWLFSTDKSGATPGVINSVTPKIYDLELDSLAINAYDGNVESDVRLQCWFINCGQKDCPGATLRVEENGTGLKTETIGPLASGRKDSLVVNVGPLPSGVHQLNITLEWAQDMAPGNDSLSVEIRTSYSVGDILLSEFMAVPGDANAEYVELYCPAGNVQLEKWIICDDKPEVSPSIPQQFSAGENSYIVLASDSSVFTYPYTSPENTVVLSHFPSFNNSSDAIVLKDPRGKTIDSLYYDDSWALTENISTERIYFTNPNIPDNWRLSTDPTGGTPGYINSVAVSSGDDKNGIKAEPNPFSPNGDGIDDEIAIIYQLPFPSAKVSVQVYDLMGRLIYEPAENMTSSSEGAIYWDGTSKYGGRARVGMYIVRCSATDMASDRTVGYITTIVLAR